MAEIQEICYLPENERTPEKILRLNNLTFIHGILLTINIRPKLKSLTERKLFGTYYHAIMCHAPTQYRILSGIVQKRSTYATETPKHCRIQSLQNQQEFAKSVSVTSTPAVVKTFILATEETIVSFKQKPVEYSKSSKMLVKIFGEQDFITKYDKHRKELKRTKNSDKTTEELYLFDVAVIEIKLKQEREKLNEIINKFEINEIVEDQQTADSTYKEKMLQKLIYINSLLKTIMTELAKIKFHCIKTSHMTKTVFKLLVIIVRSIQNGVVRFSDTHYSVYTPHSN